MDLSTITQPIIMALLKRTAHNRTAKRRRLRWLLAGLIIKIWFSGRFDITFSAIYMKTDHDL